MTLKEYAIKLKFEFHFDPRYEGYDPDEDRGYFVQWLIERMYKDAKRKEVPSNKNS